MEVSNGKIFRYFIFYTFLRGKMKIHNNNENFYRRPVWGWFYYYYVYELVIVVVFFRQVILKLMVSILCYSILLVLFVLFENDSIARAIYDVISHKEIMLLMANWANNIRHYLHVVFDALSRFGLSVLLPLFPAACGNHV